ncbi:MAG: hypothetical protein J7K72_02650 [Candidatus Aenigmarchaeota archaeon]|nr:hypothetical protein [Candidatus Aenigmarchaeota archaeon]
MGQKILGSGEVRIIADRREAKTNILQYLESFNAVVVIDQLDTGDYICSDRVCVERKTVSDFLNSITDQRIFDQSRNLTEQYEKPVIVIEGSYDLLYLERNLHPNTIRGTLASLAIDYKIPILWSSDPRETAALLYWIAYREQIKEKRNISIRVSKRFKTFTEQQEFLISGLPGVNTKLSRNLLNKFKTPKKIFSASISSLMKVEGIGKKKAEKIWKLLNTNYE